MLFEPEASSPLRAASGREYVLLLDADPSRRQKVDAAIRQAGVLTRGGAIDASGECASCVVLAVSRSFDDPDLCASAARLRTRRVPIIPYGSGTGSWTLDERLRVLVVLGRMPLDMEADTFDGTLTAAVVQAVDTGSRLREERRRVVEVMDQLDVVGRSDQLIDVFRWVLRVSVLSDVPALICGATGTGKELVARAIHSLDPKRSRGPFVAINCAAIAPPLAEAELFGHRRGAFTGADRDRPGLFRAADGGVLFLDEIGELDAAIQAKLLRTLQDGRVLGVGSDRDTAVSVRVVAATNRDIGEMTRAGTFRADLYHRLNAVSTRISPLVERADDVAPLVEFFVSRYRAELGTGHVGVDPEFVDGLVRSGLPGNVRQVDNLVRRALVERDTVGSLSLPDLPRELWTSPSAGAADDASEAPASAGAASGVANRTVDAVAATADWNLSRTLKECEALLVSAALTRTGGSQARAARLLGITPRSMYNKTRRHHLLSAPQDSRSRKRG
jgi:transcriptional regulator with GAF, ATPase, and Fis domain